MNTGDWSIGRPSKPLPPIPSTRPAEEALMDALVGRFGMVYALAFIDALYAGRELLADWLTELEANPRERMP